MPLIIGAGFVICYITVSSPLFFTQIKEEKSENVRGGIMETVKQCSARLNEPRRCASPKVAPPGIV